MEKRSSTNKFRECFLMRLSHNHFTREQGNLYMMRPKHEYARYCIRYFIPFIVNKAHPKLLIKLILIDFKGFRNILILKC